jgi:hypothetical protein
MAALVVVNVSKVSGDKVASARLDIFPGGATPSVFPADTPFWVAYGFAPDSGAPTGSVAEGTRFELDVEGAHVDLESELEEEAGVVTGRTDRAGFPSGLPAGWHTFHGRWYDAGKLLLSNRVSVEFVER